MMELYASSNPHRVPDWRWQLARYLQEHQLRLTRTEGDRWVSFAKQFSTELDNADSESQQHELRSKYSALHWALALYRATTFKNARFELEARLLSREPRQKIAAKTGIALETINAYALVFFDVEDRLKHPSYISHVVIGDLAKRGISERDPATLWKMLGYWCGPDVLDMAIYRFGRAAKPGSPQDLSAFISDDIREQLQLKTMVAIRSMQISSQTQTEIVGLYLKHTEIEKQAGEGDGGQSSLKAGIQAMLENLPWTRDAALAAKRGLTNTIQGTGVGLRAEEVILTANGQPPANLHELAAGAVYPERTRRTTVSW